MKEELLHFIWKNKLFYKSKLFASDASELEVQSVGYPNHNSGPDFFNAKIVIDGQLWAGNVELHLKSSDWYVHNHENDEQYDAVVLHVVWEYDVDVFNHHNQPIPTLELREFVSNELLETFQKLFSKPQKWIPCERMITTVKSITIHSCLERMYIERLESKSKLIEELLVETNFDWEAVLFQLLAKNFGLKVNSEVFFYMANSLDFSIVKKERQDVIRLESLLFGQLGMLKKNFDNSYYNNLKEEYGYQLKKYGLKTDPLLKVQYFRLRPMNFPTIRISQLANLIYSHPSLFSKLIALHDPKDFYDIFDVRTTEFWETHYTFEKESTKRKKRLTTSFVDLILINTIIPLKFVYLKHHGKTRDASCLTLIKKLKPEVNRIIQKFKELKIPVESAFESQALIQLKNAYCTPKKCLHCTIGLELLKN